MGVVEHKSVCPCRGCEDRQVGCHSKCEGYKEWASKHEKLKEKERSSKVYVSSGWGYIPRKKRKVG